MPSLWARVFSFGLKAALWATSNYSVLWIAQWIQFYFSSFSRTFFFISQEPWGFFFYNQFNILGTLLYVHIALFAQRVWDQSIKKYLITVIGRLNLTQNPLKYKIKQNLKKELKYEIFFVEIAHCATFAFLMHGTYCSAACLKNR